MDLKSFVDRATDAANKAALKAQEAVNNIAATTPAPVAEAAPEAPSPADDPAAEGTELALAESAAPSDAVAPIAPASAPVPAPTKTFGAIASDKLNEFSAISTQKIQELMTSFQQALPAIKTGGYELTEFEVELGVTPKLIPHFRHAKKSAEDVEAARAMLKDNKLGMMILNALLKAGDVHRQIKVAGFAFTHIEIEMGLIPCVRLQYKNEIG
jgi:hypothetical protein